MAEPELDALMELGGGGALDVSELVSVGVLRQELTGLSAAVVQGFGDVQREAVGAQRSRTLN